MWPVKDYIDRKFMSMYSTQLDAMADKMMSNPRPSSKAEEQGVAAAAGPDALVALSAAKMRCGGCGGKVSRCEGFSPCHPCFCVALASCGPDLFAPLNVW